eukprot:scaffold325519_cov54-Tisochrysis_lutea.AAC.4
MPNLIPASCSSFVFHGATEFRGPHRDLGVGIAPVPRHTENTEVAWEVAKLFDAMQPRRWQAGTDHGVAEFGRVSSDNTDEASYSGAASLQSLSYGG